VLPALLLHTSACHCLVRHWHFVLKVLNHTLVEKKLYL